MAGGGSGVGATAEAGSGGFGGTTAGASAVGLLGDAVSTFTLELGAEPEAAGPADRSAKKPTVPARANAPSVALTMIGLDICVFGRVEVCATPPTPPVVALSERPDPDSPSNRAASGCCEMSLFSAAARTVSLPP